MFHYHPHTQMSESFLVAAFLSFSGGLQDVYTYIARGAVFANAQTGNIVLLSRSAFSGNWPSFIHYMIPVLFFALGIAAAEVIRHYLQKSYLIHWRQIVLVMEILLLSAVGFMPDTWNLMANALVSFSCAMQVQTFRKVNSYAFASTMCIGNIRSGMDALCTYFMNHDRLTLFKSFHYFGVIFLFAMGAGTGSLLIPRWGLHTIWLSCFLLLVGFCLMFIKAYQDRKP